MAESVFPGGCAHACELETSMLLHLAPESVRMDKIKSELSKTNELGSKFTWTDLFASGPMGLVEWTSQYSDTGVIGEAEKATAEKGKMCLEEASRNLATFIAEYQARELHHARPIRPNRRRCRWRFRRTTENQYQSHTFEEGASSDATVWHLRMPNSSLYEL